MKKSSNDRFHRYVAKMEDKGLRRKTIWAFDNLYKVIKALVDYLKNPENDLGYTSISNVEVHTSPFGKKDTQIVLIIKGRRRK